MIRTFEEHPLLIPVVGLALGGVSCVYGTIAIPYWLLAIVLVLLIVTLQRRFAHFFYLLLLLFCFGWGTVAVRSAMVNQNGLSPEVALQKSSLIVEGLVVQRPVELPQGQRFELELERIITQEGDAAAAGRLLVTLANGQGAWLSGDRLRMRGVLRIPQPLGLPGEFDYGRYLALHGINATLWVQDVRHITLMRAAARPSWLRLLDQAALQCNQVIHAAVPDPAAAAVLMALVTGSQSAIPPVLATAYARSGVSHILSISGFHVAIVAMVTAQVLLLLLLRYEWLALRYNLRRAALFASLPVIIGYLLFTGGAPATARSVIMLSAIVLALWAERESEILDALLLAAFVLLVMTPLVLFDLSFQLSFVSLWGIVVMTPSLMAPCKERLTGWRQAVVLFFAASFAAIMATAVPVLVAFHQVSLTGILANLVVVPLLGYGVVLLGAAAVPFVGMAPSLAGWLFEAAGWLVQLSNQFVVWVAKLPVVRFYQLGGIDLAASIIVLMLLTFVRSSRRKYQLVCGVGVLALSVHLWPAHQAADRLRMTFLSVGQGEATLIQFPDQSTMLIDGGGYLRETEHDFGERYLVPALYRLGVSRIDRLVLTHPHPDHLGGLPAVAEQLPIGEFWQVAGQGMGGGDYLRLQQALQRNRVPVRELLAGSRAVDCGGSRLTVLAPEPEAAQLHHDETGNEGSLVLHLTFKRFKALFMADAGLNTEQQLIDRQPALSAVLLKVGHHGSRSATGDPFLRTVKPRLAVISVGAGNRFGLPAEETVARLQRQGAEVCRTDRDGTLLVETDGERYWVSKHLEQR